MKGSYGGPSKKFVKLNAYQEAACPGSPHRHGDAKLKMWHLRGLGHSNHAGELCAMGKDAAPFFSHSAGAITERRSPMDHSRFQST